MARDTRSYSADNTTQLGSIGMVKTGGGFKDALDLPQNRITSEKSDGKGPGRLAPSASSMQASNTSAGKSLKMGSGISKESALGDIKQSGIK